MAGSSCSSSGNQAWHLGGAGQQQAPLPASQSQLDLESFAASILLDDLQIATDDSSAQRAPPPGDTSCGDQAMQLAAAQDSDDSAWVGEPGFEPELSALAAGDFSLQSPFAELPGGDEAPPEALGRSSSIAMGELDRQQQPFFNPAAVESPCARLPQPPP